jgi:hypothetical protein
LTPERDSARIDIGAAWPQIDDKGEKTMETTNRQQQMPTFAEPQQEHHWLQRFVGEWIYEGECPGGPGQPAQKMTWTENVRSLGGLWILAEGQGDMPGGEAGTVLMTLGYDPERKKYVGTFVGSMMTHLWVYEGTLDETGRVLTLDTEGPDMSGGAPQGKMVKYQDIYEIKSEDHRTLTSQMLGDDGKWQLVMRAEYQRKK